MASQIKLGDIVVDVVLKDIKNVHLSVHPPAGRVRISAPKRMSLATIRVFIISKLDWIKRQQAKIRQQERETPREYVDRESHYVWGKRYLLTVSEHDEPPSIELQHSRMLLRVRPGTDEHKRHAPNGPDDHPVVNVIWDDAIAYADWLGGTLPTGAQWEFAARGRDGRKYPWGDEDVTCERANYAECERTAVAVKSYEAGATPEGIYDLAGNVWEWCLDWYAPYESTGQTDPTGPAESSVSRPARVLRGGSFSFNPWYLRAAFRYDHDPGGRYDYVGFRVAWASSGGLE